MSATHRSGSPTDTPDPCTLASPRDPHGVPVRRALSGLCARAGGRRPGTAVALWSRAAMRLLAPAVLCLLLVSPALAGARRCGDDVDGQSVPCDCGDLLVGSRTLGDDDPITSRVCPGDGLVVRIPGGAAGVLDLAGHVIAGSGHGVGIQMLQGGEGFTISGPGSVTGFDTGVQATAGAIARIAA